MNSIFDGMICDLLWPYNALDPSPVPAEASRLVTQPCSDGLESLERTLQVRLFERSAIGYTPTPAGEELSVSAARIEEEVFRVERLVVGQDIRPFGTVRVTTTDTLLVGLLTPICADFHRQYPRIELEVAVSPLLFNLSKREADIALRPTPRPQDALAGRKVGEIAQAAYVSLEHPAATRDDAPLKDFEWIGSEATLSDTRCGKSWPRVSSTALLSVRSRPTIGACRPTYSRAPGRFVAANPSRSSERGTSERVHELRR